MDGSSNYYPNNNKFVYPQQFYYNGDPNRVSPYVCNQQQLLEQQKQQLPEQPTQSRSERVQIAYSKQPQELLQLLEQQKQHLPQKPSQSRTEPAQIDYSKLTTFLEVDNSFLTPWNWKPQDVDNDNGPKHTKHMMNIQPGSFFTYDVSDMGKQMLKYPESVGWKQASDKKKAVQSDASIRNQQA